MKLNIFEKVAVALAVILIPAVITAQTIDGGGPNNSLTRLVTAGTKISGGTNKRVLYNNNGTLGEYTVTGIGTVVAMASAPNLVAPDIGDATAASLTVFNGDPLAQALTVRGAIVNRSSTIQYFGVGGGTADVITLTPPLVSLTNYTLGSLYFYKSTAANATTTPTINISGLGAITIVKRAATALAAGDITNGGIIMLMYDGTNMQLINPVVN